MSEQAIRNLIQVLFAQWQETDSPARKQWCRDGIERAERVLERRARADIERRYSLTEIGL
jgi:hypothetical protein